MNAGDFKSDADKWAFLRDAPRRDAREHVVRRLAVLLDELSFGDPDRFLELAHCFVTRCIRFESDTARVGGEDIPRAGQLSEVIRRGVDDCDAKARLMVALCLVRGLEARMVDHWNGDELRHVSAEVRVSSAAPWQHFECTLRRALPGERAEQVPKEPDGRWLR